VIQLRKVRGPDRPSGGATYRPGEYDAYIRVPGTPGEVLFGHIARTGRPGVDHYPWEWWLDSDFVLPPTVVETKPKVTGHNETRKAAKEKLDLLSKAVADALRPDEDEDEDVPGDWELDEWVPREATVDAAQLTRVLNVLDEMFDVWLVDDQQGTLEEKVRLYAKLRDLHKRDGRIDTVIHDLKVDLKEELTVAEVDGRIWKAKRTNKRSGYDKDGLRQAINAAALRAVPDFDEETGEVLGTHEPTPAEAVDTVWKGADVATGRTKVLREAFGVDLDEYAQSNWVTEIVELAENDLKPEERLALYGEEETNADSE
jgi:hypothetical protein